MYYFIYQRNLYTKYKNSLPTNHYYNLFYNCCKYCKRRVFETVLASTTCQSNCKTKTSSLYHLIFPNIRRVFLRKYQLIYKHLSILYKRRFFTFGYFDSYADEIC